MTRYTLLDIPSLLVLLASYNQLVNNTNAEWEWFQQKVGVVQKCLFLMLPQPSASSFATVPFSLAMPYMHNHV